MTPKEFHKACHEAILQCPQFRGYDDDTRFDSYGKFGKIHKKGWVTLLKFWREEDLLWDSGYYQALPLEAQRIFEGLEKAIEKAIEDFMKGC